MPRRNGRPAPFDSAPHALLALLGRRIRSQREMLGLSRPALATRCGLSSRFLAQVETGQGNISLARLERLAQALGLPLVDLVAPEGGAGRAGRQVLALLGLRGAGKSTLGAEVAGAAGLAFVEHDRLVEEAAGMNLAEVFAIHGDVYYRRLARETLARFLGTSGPPAVLATAGGLVTDGEAFDQLLRHTVTVWLSATPDDHWHRVVEQGDRRPMRDRPEARQELERLLRERQPLYSKAAHHVDTSRLGRAAAAAALVNLVRGLDGRVARAAPPTQSVRRSPH